MRKNTTTRETVHLGDIPASAAAVAVLAAANRQIRTEPEPLEELGERLARPLVVSPETLEELQERIENPRQPTEALRALFVAEHEELLEPVLMPALSAPGDPCNCEAIRGALGEADPEDKIGGHEPDCVATNGLAQPAPDKGE